MHCCFSVPKIILKCLASPQVRWGQRAGLGCGVVGGGCWPLIMVSCSQAVVRGRGGTDRNGERVRMDNM